MPKKPSQAQLSELYGISRPTLNKWANDGLNVYHLEAVAKKVMSMEKKPPNLTQSVLDKIKELVASAPAPSGGLEIEECESLEEARKKDVEASTALKKLKIAKEEGQLISIDQAKEQVVRIVSGFRAVLEARPQEKATYYEGKTANFIEKDMREWNVQMMEQLSDELSVIYKPE